jgi:outer membrane lipoprotein-sorting protein
MSRLISGIGSFVVTVSMCCVAALAADYPKKIYDATYDIVNASTGKATMRMVSDGKGHVRTETTMPNSKFITIADYPKLESMTILEAQKMVMKGKLSAESYQGSEPDEMKKKNAKDLGSKVVAGHPCHGYEYTTKQGAYTSTTETWIGNDMGCFVQSTTTTPQGKSVTTLKSFSTKAPDVTLFSMTPPAGYKVTVTK